MDSSVWRLELSIAPLDDNLHEGEHMNCAQPIAVSHDLAQA